MPTLENACRGACLGLSTRPNSGTGTARHPARDSHQALHVLLASHCGAWRNDKEAQQISPLLRRSTLQAQMNSGLVYDLEREAMHDDASSSHHATTLRGRSLREVSMCVERGGKCEGLCKRTDPPGKTEYIQGVLADSASAKLLSAHETILVVASGNCEAISSDVGTLGRAWRAQRVPSDIARTHAGTVRPSRRAEDRVGRGGKTDTPGRIATRICSLVSGLSRWRPWWVRLAVWVTRRGRARSVAGRRARGSPARVARSPLRPLRRSGWGRVSLGVYLATWRTAVPAR